VSEDRPGPARLVEALGVTRNARIGFGIGVALAVLMYVYRIAELGGPVEPTVPTNATGTATAAAGATATPDSPILFLMLAVVLAVSAGALVTALLTVGSAIRLARDVE